MDELEVHGGGQVRVPEPGLAGPHRILPAAEVRQALDDERFQGRQGLRPRDGPGEVS